MVIERRSPDAAAIRARIDQYLAGAGAGGRVRVVPLTGDASDRRYFRVRQRSGTSQVLAVHPGPIEFETLPFVNVARLLSEMPVPVPRILGHSDALGIIALEDLGDVTLQAHLGTASPAEHAGVYRQAVALVTTIQRRGRELESPDYIPYGITFDVDKLMWELQFFARHFLEGYRGAVISDAARQELEREFWSIAEELASEPRVLCHRDYHSRNLMIHGGRLYIIDFQDARLGPDTYDLASLLRDSYVDLSEQQVDEMVAFFLADRGTGFDREGYRRRFDLMSLQRNLKALGTFGFQTTGRANPVYIQFIPRTLSCIRTNLAKYPRFGRLRDLLATHLPEVR